MNVKVKVCGITSLADAEKSLELGADMLGFNFYPPSPRFLAPQKAREIIQRLPADSFNVALFVNEPRKTVSDVIAPDQLDSGQAGYLAAQFHGEENAEYCFNWGVKIIKAFRLKERSSLMALNHFPADFYLLDSWSPGYGGSGAAFPWEWADGLEASKLILSGGLCLENVAAAIKRVHPFGVDVCSGVEARPGVKDYEKLKEFIIAAKGA
jgi:phosphoribosylanthranilate isomerase